MDTLEEILDSIKDATLDAAKTEFKDYLNQAKNDPISFAKDTALMIETWLLEYAQGKLTKDELEFLFDECRAATLQHLNTLNIESRARLQKILNGLLDIAANVLLTAIRI